MPPFNLLSTLLAGGLRSQWRRIRSVVATDRDAPIAHKSIKARFPELAVRSLFALCLSAGRETGLGVGSGVGLFVRRMMQDRHGGIHATC